MIMLDRPRHEETVKQIREAGARIRFIIDGDVSAALLAVTEGPGSICSGASAARRRACCRRRRSSAWAASSWAASGPATTMSARPRSTPATTSTRCSTSIGWSAAATSSSPPPGSPTAICLQGVRYLGDGHATTESLVMRSRSGTVRKVQARQTGLKLREVTGGRYG